MRYRPSVLFFACMLSLAMAQSEAPPAADAGKESGETKSSEPSAEGTAPAKPPSELRDWSKTGTKDKDEDLWVKKGAKGGLEMDQLWIIQPSLPQKKDEKKPQKQQSLDDWKKMPWDAKEDPMSSSLGKEEGKDAGKKDDLKNRDSYRPIAGFGDKSAVSFSPITGQGSITQKEFGSKEEGGVKFSETGVGGDHERRSLTPSGLQPGVFSGVGADTQPRMTSADPLVPSATDAGLQGRMGEEKNYWNTPVTQESRPDPFRTNERFAAPSFSPIPSGVDRFSPTAGALPSRSLGPNALAPQPVPRANSTEPFKPLPRR